MSRADQRTSDQGLIVGEDPIGESISLVLSNATPVSQFFLCFGEQFIGGIVDRFIQTVLKEWGDVINLAKSNKIRCLPVEGFTCSHVE